MWTDTVNKESEGRHLGVAVYQDNKETLVRVSKKAKLSPAQNIPGPCRFAHTQTRNTICLSSRMGMPGSIKRPPQLASNPVARECFSAVLKGSPLLPLDARRGTAVVSKFQEKVFNCERAMHSRRARGLETGD